MSQVNKVVTNKVVSKSDRINALFEKKLNEFKTEVLAELKREEGVPETSAAPAQIESSQSTGGNPDAPVISEGEFNERYTNTYNEIKNNSLSLAKQHEFMMELWKLSKIKVEQQQMKEFFDRNTSLTLGLLGAQYDPPKNEVKEEYQRQMEILEKKSDTPGQ